jgi:phosphatidyl-myo-inositol dimannoside synthase
MKSLLVSSSYFPPQTGGISRFMGEVASALGRHRVCCLTGVPSERIPQSNTSGPRVYRCSKAFAGSKTARASALGGTIAQIMFRERPRIVQISMADDGYIGLLLRRWLTLPYVIYAYGNEIYSALNSSSQKPRLSLERASCVLAVSRFTADLVKQARIPPANIEIVHPGCDVELFRPREVPVDIRQKLLGSMWRDQIILSVGNLVGRKGHDMVVRALPALIKRIPKVTYLIAGDGPYRSKLEALAMDLGVRERVLFLGRPRDEDLPSIYSLCDVFAMPSREQTELCDVEGFGIVFLEASACAKPVIGGRSGGVADAVVDGITGFLVDPLNPEAIADSIERLLADHALASRLGEQGRLRAVCDFTWRSAADRIQAILEGVFT